MTLSNVRIITVEHDPQVMAFTGKSALANAQRFIAEISKGNFMIEGAEWKEITE